jgi:acyl-CoA reductase-like NAD-dependent aldehyde dehydrogenase
MTALEEYTAHHAESVQEIMYRWGWRRFEGMFRLHLLRKAREELRQMRDLRLAALDANTNFDSEENQQAKVARAEGYHKAYVEGVKILYSDPDEVASEDPYDDDPLFDPLRRRAQTLQQEATQPLVKQAGVGRQLLEATS